MLGIGVMSHLKPEEISLGDGMKMQVRIGRELLTASGIGEQVKLGEALAEHVVYCLDEIVAMSRSRVSIFNDTNNFGWDFLSVLDSLQASEPDDPRDHLRRTVEDYRKWARLVNQGEVPRLAESCGDAGHRDPRPEGVRCLRRSRR